jgi:murein DD-endopeptidase MepM/ murein hydrolase activator NlpD
MAAPLVAAALKLAAKKVGQQVASAAIKKGGGGRMDPQTKFIIITVMIFALIITGAIVQGVSTVLSTLLPQNALQCDVPKTGNLGDSHDATNGGPGGSADGSLGSNIEYPTTDTEKVVYPVPNPNIASGYGYRAVPAGTADFFGTGTYFHNGLDFAQPLGSPIFAAADGIVAQSAPNNEKYGYGTVVTIHHQIGGEKMNTTYGHVLPSSLKFKVGDTVKAGDVIAAVGSEGNSTGAHLHFVVTKGIYTIQSEINKGPANNIDPVPWFSSNGAKQTTGTVGSGGDGASSPEKTAELCNKKKVTDGTITAWGGHKNGAIPEDAMEPLSFNKNLKLERETSKKLEALNNAYKSKFNTDLPVVSAYMDAAAQGGSPNNIAGWAKSIELSDAVTFESEEYKWLASNAISQGWMNPIINQKDGSNPRSTRWVYVGDQTDFSADIPADLSEYQRYAAERLNTAGIGGPTELTCLIRLWNRESEWKVDAENQNGGAYGIPQSLPGNKMASEGADWRTNYKTQINWGVKYIQGRYGTSCSAWQHSEDFNWY